MLEPIPPLNPYAPPASIIRKDRLAFEHLIWREGDFLVIRNAAELPRFCVVTGEPAPYSHPISQIWQPRWAYLLLFLAVVPYLVFSPFVHRRVEMMVPFGRTIHRKHRRWVQLGIGLMLTGGLLIVGFIALSIGQWLSGPVAIMLTMGVVLFLVGLQFASSSPMRLNILKVEEDLIFIANVHPDYLARLPDMTEIATIEPR